MSKDCFWCAGEKTLKKDEFLAIFKEAKNIKDSGVYEDFIECLKLYDKQEDGTMMGAELQHILVSLGEYDSHNSSRESTVGGCRSHTHLLANEHFFPYP